jgi:hypothetical protein
MCPRAVDEMLLVLITTLNRDFLADIIPCSAPRAPDQGQHHKETAETLVCIGSSNLQRAIPYFTNLGYTVIDMTQKGWIISQNNVGTLLDRLRAADLPSGLTVVFELFGNSTYRWVQEDGTLALPLKTGSGYHLPGRITVCDDKVFKGLVESVLPLFHFFKESGKVVVPPLPRYVFRGCCPEFAHAPNVAEQEHASEILSKGTHLRGILKKQLLGSGLQKFWVCEAGKVLMPTSCANASDFLLYLQEISQKDGVHFTSEGYHNFAKNVREIILTKLERVLSGQSSAASVLSGSTRRRWYWRGFQSPVGAAGPANSAGSYKRMKQLRTHPYRPHMPGRGGRRRN